MPEGLRADSTRIRWSWPLSVERNCSMIERFRCAWAMWLTEGLQRWLADTATEYDPAMRPDTKTTCFRHLTSRVTKMSASLETLSPPAAAPGADDLLQAEGAPIEAQVEAVDNIPEAVPALALQIDGGMAELTGVRIRRRRHRPSLSNHYCLRHIGLDDRMQLLDDLLRAGHEALLRPPPIEDRKETTRASHATTVPDRQHTRLYVSVAAVQGWKKLERQDASRINLRALPFCLRFFWRLAHNPRDRATRRKVCASKWQVGRAVRVVGGGLRDRWAST